VTGDASTPAGASGRRRAAREKTPRCAPRSRRGSPGASCMHQASGARRAPRRVVYHITWFVPISFRRPTKPGALPKRSRLWGPGRGTRDPPGRQVRLGPPAAPILRCTWRSLQLRGRCSRSGVRPSPASRLSGRAGGRGGTGAVHRDQAPPALAARRRGWSGCRGWPALLAGSGGGPGRRSPPRRCGLYALDLGAHRRRRLRHALSVR